MMATQVLVDADIRREVVDNVGRALAEHYVFADLAQQMSDALQSALAAHVYDDLDTPEALCERLTGDLQAICHDKHVRVRYNEEPRSVDNSGGFSQEDMAAYMALARTANFGFYKVERMPGNVGYLDLRNFWEVGWEGASETAIGAMNLLVHTDALIIDLRQNGGGTPSMVALITSFLLGPEPVHLNSFYDRSGDKLIQSWTLSYIPGKRTPDKPLYVLTSRRTFSGAEEFAYNLKNLKRATIIGETTGGAAHPGEDISVTPHFRVFVPSGRPINPISGTNWEGTGVEPDIAVSQQDAHDVAYRLALEAVLAKLGDASTGALKMQADEARTALANLESQPTL